jgi:hypothetical protein
LQLLSIPRLSCISHLFREHEPLGGTELNSELSGSAMSPTEAARTRKVSMLPMNIRAGSTIGGMVHAAEVLLFSIVFTFFVL